MAHFAQIDENNVVTQVLVVPDEQEHRGEDFLANDLGLGGRWVQTSYNHHASPSGPVPRRLVANSVTFANVQAL